MKVRFLRLDGNGPTPSRAYLGVSFQSGDEDRSELTAVNSGGERTGAAFDQLVARAGRQPQVQHAASHRLDEKAALVGCGIAPLLALKNQIEITLYWQALAAMKKDYTVFVHVVDRDGNLVAQEDSQPNKGLSPTSVWEEGEIIEDRHVVHLAPSAGQDHYTVQVGLYDLATMTRVPAFDADGSRLRHDVVILEEEERSSWLPAPGQPTLVGPRSSLHRSRGEIVVPGESPENPLSGLT